MNLLLVLNIVQFTHNIKHDQGSINILRCSRCYGLQPLMTSTLQLPVACYMTMTIKATGFDKIVYNLYDWRYSKRIFINNRQRLRDLNTHLEDFCHGPFWWCHTFLIYFIPSNKKLANCSIFPCTLYNHVISITDPIAFGDTCFCEFATCMYSLQ